MINVRPSALSVPVISGGGASATPPVMASAQSSAQSTAQQPASAQPVAVSSIFSSIWSAITGFVSGVVNWIKGLFGGSSSPTTGGLTAAQQALATQYGLLPTASNITAFQTEVSQYATNGTLGPGSTNTGAITQLQTALSQLGYSVSVTGQYDQATSAAVTQFKVDNGLHQTYQAANGNWAVNEYATPDVASALIAKIKQKLGISN